MINNKNYLAIKETKKENSQIDMEERLRQIELSKSVTFLFRNNELCKLWKEQIVPQLTEGKWKNARNGYVTFWSNIKTEVDNETKIVGDIPSKAKRNFAFNILIDEHLDSLMTSLDKGRKPKDLLMYFKEISSAMRQ